MASPMQAYGPQSQPLPGGGQLLQTPRFGQEQSALMQNLAQLGAQNFNPQAQEDRARKLFTSETIPGLAERFTALGGGQKSSAFQGALGQAGADLESQLAAQRQGFGLQALNLGLQPQFESHLQPSSSQAGLKSLLGGLGAAAPGLIEAGGKYLLGGQGGAAQQPQGTGIGSAIGNLSSAAAPAVGSAVASGAGAGGFGASLAGLGAAAAPFALPLAAGAAVIGLPLLLSYLLED